MSLLRSLALACRRPLRRRDLLAKQLAPRDLSDRPDRALLTSGLSRSMVQPAPAISLRAEIPLGEGGDEADLDEQADYSVVSYRHDLGGAAWAPAVLFWRACSSLWIGGDP